MFFIISDNTKRVTNALQTLCVLILAIFKKSSALEPGFDIINTMMGFGEAEEKMKTLISQCNKFLISEAVDSPRSLCLKLLLILVTGTDNISQNVLLEYVMMNSLFDSLVRLLSDPILRIDFGHDAVVLLTLLVNYRKHEGNPVSLCLLYVNRSNIIFNICTVCRAIIDFS